MKHWAWLVLPLVAAWTGGCVSSQDAKSSAVRLLNAIPDSSRMALVVSGQGRSSAADYGDGTRYLAIGVGRFSIRVDEALAADADPGIRTLYEAEHQLDVNDELTFVMLGQEASDIVEVLPVRSRTRGVTIGKTRMQFVHAGFGMQPVDIYVGEPDFLPQATAPLAAAMAYGEHTTQVEVAGGNGQIVVTPAGDPTVRLFESGPMQLPAEGTWLVAVIANMDADAMEHPVNLSVLTGSGSQLLRDRAAGARLRFVNASPGSYAIDSFVNGRRSDMTTRQACVDPDPDAPVVLEECGQPYRFVGSFHELPAGTYEIKTQKAGDAEVAARSATLSLAAGVGRTLVTTGFIDDEDETTTTGLHSLDGSRRMAVAAQLRVLNLSLSAMAALEDEPAEGFLELHLGPACEPIGEEPPLQSRLGFGADTQYVALEAGDYQLTLARADSTDSGTTREALLSRRLTLAAGGIYTELITDAVGAEAPAELLSLDDDPMAQSCPAP